MKRLFFQGGVIALLFMVSAPFAASFSGDDMDALLQSSELSRGMALALVSEAGAAYDPDVNFREQMALFYERDQESSVSLGEYSYMIMKAFSIRGGIFYSLFPCGRYASRELSFRGYLTGDSGAFRKISGREALGILGRVLEDKETR